MASLIGRQLLSFAAVAAAILWLRFVAPWIARLFGLPLRGTIWTKERQNQHLTKAQFILAVGILEIGLAGFIWCAWEDALPLILRQETAHFTLFRLSFDLGFWLIVGAVIGLISASSQVGESPVLTIELSKKQKL
jgi:hypothetical protein